MTSSPLRQNVFNANRARYEELSQLPQTVEDELVTRSSENTIDLTLEMPAHSVRLIKLTPSNLLSTNGFGR
jgi:hypothetical protein